jgi:hypothetical protein
MTFLDNSVLPTLWQQFGECPFLTNALVAEWKQVPTAMFQTLVECLPRRVEAVTAANGDQLHIDAIDFGIRCSTSRCPHTFGNVVSSRNSLYTQKSLFLSNSVHKSVFIPVCEHFSFSKIFHPPDRCGISRSWLNSTIITQVHLVLGTIKAHSKIVLSHNTLPQMFQV